MIEFGLQGSIGTLAEGSRIFWPKGEPFFEGSNSRAFSYLVLWLKVHAFFGPRVSHFLKVRTAELLATINIMKCAKYDHSHLHFLLVFFLTHLRNGLGRVGRS